MKIRNGFVSNSSSSSFIVFFPKEPQTREQVKEMMFRDLSDSDMIDHYDEHKTVEEVTKRVFDDIKNQKVNDIKAAADEYDIYDVAGCPKTSEYIEHLTGALDWNRYDKDCEEFSKKEFEKLIKEHQNEIFYTFEYEDNIESVLEHGDIFRNLFNVRMSKH